jgi:hypothetical protein
VSRSKHGVSFQIVSRNPNVWQGKCGRHATFTGASYAAVEDAWREHVWREAGNSPTPTPNQDEPRWEVPA